jgi:hypothetical protein
VKGNMYTMSDKRILEDLNKSNFTWGMQLEMARKYNQGDTTFANLGAGTKQRAFQIVNRINQMDTALLERITKIAQENNLF